MLGNIFIAVLIAGGLAGGVLLFMELRSKVIAKFCLAVILVALLTVAGSLLLLCWEMIVGGQPIATNLRGVGRVTEQLGEPGYWMILALLLFFLWFMGLCVKLCISALLGRERDKP